MRDEIDLLCQFRADTPEPDDAAWERARAAIAMVSRSPGGELAAAELAGAELAAIQPRRDRRRWRTHGRRVPITAALASIAVAAAGLLAVSLQGHPTLSQPMTTAWQPARQLPSQGHTVRAPAGSWRLMSYLEAKGWQQNTAGPEPGLLTCPTAMTCYVEGNSATSPSGPADMDSFYVSNDGTQTWSVLPLPAGVTFESALACATGESCAAGALYYGSQPIYLSTTTGGHSWTVRPLPAGLGGGVGDLTCVTATHCRGLAAARKSDPVAGLVLPTFSKLVSTVDGGRHWAIRAFPAADGIESLSCPTATECVAAGVTGRHQGTAVVVVSRDGGATWRHGVIHGPLTAPAFPAVTCVDASHCRMLGYFVGKGSVTVRLGAGMSQSGPLEYSVFQASSDGGATWTSSKFPRSIPYPDLDALVCPTVQTCYAAGGDAIPQHIGNTWNGGSSVVAVTRDAGRTWQRVSFAVPAKVPNGMQGDSFLSIGQIECPRPDACVAIGISDQGSTSTPIYTNHG